jgi:beta-xylosidase
MPIQYKNPVYPLDFADPFVLKTQRGYYAYGTAAPGSDGRIFPVLHSRDLVHWEKIGGALVPLENPAAYSYWAPEVLEKNGRYYLYYSASTSRSDEHHRLRVATSDNPAGPFTDSGHLLLPGSGFSIDANPFHDPQSGKHFLFFAKDYESDEPWGTGLAVAELSSDLLTVISEATPVIRARADWQIYERNRQYKGRLWAKWHCVEGPSVIFHEGKYYCFYSAGAWYGDTYGVGFAVADNPLGPWRDDTSQDTRVLKGMPGTVIGPGHNSTVVSLSGKLYMVYHAWDDAKTARRMCIDPIRWSINGPAVEGPSTSVKNLE